MTLDDFIQKHIGLSKIHSCLYHFTDRRNLASIQRHGLLSFRQLESRGIAIPAPGGNDWSRDADARFGVDGYVHLSFISNHPMAYNAKRDGRIKDLVHVEVSPEVVRLKGVLATNDVSNKSGITPILFDEMLDKLDLSVIYTRTDWKDPAVQARLQAARKYEILVPDAVLSKYILRFV